ncbi:unnamed protein product, partial [Brassica napus]
ISIGLRVTKLRLSLTIQILKDLMTQVDRLKAEYVTLSQESREVDD